MEARNVKMQGNSWFFEYEVTGMLDKLIDINWTKELVAIIYKRVLEFEIFKGIKFHA
jgi:hypothetical protein